MGIQHLNKYIRNKITLYNSNNNNNNNKEEGSAIKTITFSELNGKTIVIDTSIYMYRFSSERYLIPNNNSINARTNPSPPNCGITRCATSQIIG